MRTLLIVAAVAATAPVRADIAFELRETVSGHPSMVVKSGERTAQVHIKGSRVARRQSDIVQIVDSAANLVTLIDYRDHRFATSNLDEVQRQQAQSLDELPQGVRTELIASGEVTTWNGRSATRDTIRINITGDPGPAEWLLKIDAIASDIHRDLEPAEQRRDQELDAGIRTLVFINTDRFKDLLTVRKAQTRGLPVRTVAEFRLKDGSPLLAALGEAVKDKSLIVVEREALNLSTDEIDFNIFVVPAGFDKVEFSDLLAERGRRAR